MPFELIFQEPPSIDHRGVLAEGRRSILRKAIGAETTSRAVEMVGLAARSPEAEGLISLHETGLLEDLKHDWLAVPVVELFDSMAQVSALDLSDNKVVGSRLRNETATLVQRAEEVVELLDFLDMFVPSIVHTLIRPACTDGLMLTSALVEWMTSETDDDSVDRGNIFDAVIDGFREHYVILHALPYGDRVAPAEPDSSTGENEFELLLGVEYPADAKRWIDVIKHLESSGHDLCELGRRQLRYFGPYQTTDPISSRNFFELALRMGQSAYPLLAHRAGYLTWQLIERATAIDETTAMSTLHSLFIEETIWMLASQEDYEGARARYLAGDQAAIVEAYGDLVEGTLRRYASLIVALERIANNQPVQNPLVFHATGDVETQLNAFKERPLPALVLRFLERGLRNADAHANVVVDVGGDLKVKLRDGTVESVVANQVYGRTAGLRSVLDGIDITMNHASICDTEKTFHERGEIDRPPMSAHMLERVVQKSAEEHTTGEVSEVNLRDDVLTMKFWGSATYEELRTFANSLIKLLSPNLPAIHILDEKDEPIEIFQPPRRRAPVGRNDPCPCGSGTKYKRCHGY